MDYLQKMNLLNTIEQPRVPANDEERSSGYVLHFESNVSGNLGDGKMEEYVFPTENDRLAYLSLLQDVPATHKNKLVFWRPHDLQTSLEILERDRGVSFCKRYQGNSYIQLLNLFENLLHSQGKDFGVEETEAGFSVYYYD